MPGMEDFVCLNPRRIRDQKKFGKNRTTRDGEIRAIHGDVVVVVVVVMVFDNSSDGAARSLLGSLQLLLNLSGK